MLCSGYRKLRWWRWRGSSLKQFYSFLSVAEVEEHEDVDVDMYHKTPRQLKLVHCHTITHTRFLVVVSVIILIFL